MKVRRGGAAGARRRMNVSLLPPSSKHRGGDGVPRECGGVCAPPPPPSPLRAALRLMAPWAAGKRRADTISMAMTRGESPLTPEKYWEHR